MALPHITGSLLVLQLLMFLCYRWRERCWLRCSVLLSDLLSWLLHERRQRREVEQLIGPCWARLTSNQNLFTTSCFHSSACARWASLEESVQLLDQKYDKIVTVKLVLGFSWHIRFYLSVGFCVDEFLPLTISLLTSRTTAYCMSFLMWFIDSTSHSLQGHCGNNILLND